MNMTIPSPHAFDPPAGCSQDSFRAIARILYDETGITMPSENTTLVVSRLARHLRDLGLADFEAYVSWISEPRNLRDRFVMISSLTTSTTRFYREPYHFDIFVTHQLPDPRARAQAGERIRLWTAGCSSGEEPYSLAATLLSHWPDVVDPDVRILATDICEPFMRIAEEGVYMRDRLDAIPEPVRRVMLSETGPENPQVACQVRCVSL